MKLVSLYSYHSHPGQQQQQHHQSSHFKAQEPATNIKQFATESSSWENLNKTIVNAKLMENLLKIWEFIQMMMIVLVVWQSLMNTQRTKRIESKIRSRLIKKKLSSENKKSHIIVLMEGEDFAHVITHCCASRMKLFVWSECNLIYDTIAQAFQTLMTQLFDY